jgi:pantetheine-phosphate adenylyltransferase
MSERHALYPGTFDPVTLGHLDILARALRVFDRVTVTVAEGSKTTLFGLDERVAMFKTAVAHWNQCDVVPFSGLLVDELRRRGVATVIRGIRSVSDYQHEWSMVGVNRILFPASEFVFLLARPDMAAVSSSLVRDVARHGGDVSPFVSPEVAAALAKRFGKGTS